MRFRHFLALCPGLARWRPAAVAPGAHGRHRLAGHGLNAPADPRAAVDQPARRQVHAHGVDEAVSGSEWPGMCWLGRTFPRNPGIEPAPEYAAQRDIERGRLQLVAQGPRRAADRQRKRGGERSAVAELTLLADVAVAGREVGCGRRPCQLGLAAYLAGAWHAS